MQLHYEKEGSGEPLIVLHGIFGNLDNLGSLCRVLADHFTLYRVDLRNHGHSPHADTMSFAEMAADIGELVDREGLDQVNLMGHSLGGKVAMAFAFANPQRVNKLVVLDIAPVTYPGGGHSAILDALQQLNPANVKSRADADEQLQAFIDEKRVRQFVLTNLVREDDNYRWRLNVSAIVNNYDSMRLGVGDDQVYQKPTLFIRGANSNYIRERNHDELYKKFPNAQLVSVDNAGHWLHAEQTETVAQHVIKFLRET